MSKPLFKLDNHLLYFDYILEYYDIFFPMFYVCKDDNGKRFLVLRMDLCENESYLITEIKLADLNDMLLGNIDIQSAFLDRTTFYEVYCLTMNCSDDIVTKCDISEFPTEYLPNKGYKYVLYDDEHREYQKRIAKELEKTNS